MELLSPSESEEPEELLEESEELEETALDCIFFLRRLGLAQAVLLLSWSSLLLLEAALEGCPEPTDI